MFNDTSSPLALLRSRRSGKARDMTAPGPDAGQLADILGIAARVPDHGKLAPWRFLVIAPERRDDLAALLTRAWLQDRPSAGRLELQATEDFARAAPCLVVLLSTPISGSKIPLTEQRMSAGAAAMNLVNAAHAHGFVANWLTGWAATHATVKQALGAGGEEDAIVGFFFIGTPTRQLEERPRPELASITRWWDGK